MTYVEERGLAVCEARWRVLLRQKADLPTPATILDLGAAEGEVSLRWAQAFGADTVVACDPCPGLLETAQAHPDRHLVVCRAALNESLLWEMGKCEHVDLILCLNLLHHFAAGWADNLAAILTLGDRVVFEVPDSHDRGACHAQYVSGIHQAVVEHLPSLPLARPLSHTSPQPRHLVQLDTPKVTLQQSYWGSPPGASKPGAIYLYRSGSQKRGVWPRKAEVRPWTPGINLATYLALDGQWPSRDALAACAQATVASLTKPHGDIRPWNWIVTGDPKRPLTLIDYDDFTSDDADGLDLTLRALEGRA